MHRLASCCISENVLPGETFYFAQPEIITFAEYLLNLVFNSFVVTLAINIPHVR